MEAIPIPSPLIEPTIPPEHTLKPEERVIFNAEQNFLQVLPRILKPGLTNPVDQKKFLRSLITDLSSTQISEEVIAAYGFDDEHTKSDVKLGERYGKSYHTINTDRRTALQALWILFHDKFPEKSTYFTTLLNQRYLKSEGEMLPSDTRILKRAEGNIGYYQDRLFIRDTPQKEDEILTLLEGLYGAETREEFAQYYRLSNHQNGIAFERRGSHPKCENSQFIRLTDVLEAGHSVAEYISTVDHGSREWIDLRGSKARGYIRKGNNFDAVLQEYQTQEKVAQILNDPDILGDLTPWQRELLMLTTKARLSGKHKNVGLEEFNKRHNRKYNLSQVADLERSLLNAEQSNYLLKGERLIRLKYLLRNQQLQQQLARELADIVDSYHIAKIALSTLAEEKGTSVDLLGETKRFLDQLILNRYGQSTRELPKKGEISKSMIDEVFVNDALPEEVILLLENIATGIRLEDVANTVNLGFPLRVHGLSYIRKLADDLVKKHQEKQL